ncbi:MAG: NUDIX hydrolase [Flavobacteriales bacterium]
MYKVFIYGHPIIFSTKHFSKLNLIQFDGKDDDAKLLKIIERMENSELAPGVEIVCENPEKLWKKFKKHYKVIEAAGGAVIKDKKLLAIFRLGKWDLPKGKMEEGESKEESAIREVEEECGISGLKIVKELPAVYHTYILNGKRILKVTYWFEMTTDFEGELKPQIEEDISQVKWVEDVKEILENTYPSLAEMIANVSLT